jgi:hypothetical protein
MIMMKIVCLTAVVLGNIIFLLPAYAQVAPCSQRAPLIWSAQIAAPLDEWLRPAYRIWGTENLAISQDGRTNALEVTYPKGSIDPATTTAPSGGAGFLYPLATPLLTGCLAYEVGFEKGFDFVKGGKQPGLYGGTAPSGGADTSMGFSMRYMWRTGGAGEVYAYVPDKSGEYGESIGRGAWSFVPGQWQRLEQEVIVNHLGQKDGVLRVWVDGKLVIERNDMLYRVNGNVLVSGLMFSTFFGGHDASWASSKTQHAFFRNFQVFGVAGAQ